ncbi:hypothetical protein D3C81_1327560 [compost metagenome]
MGIGQGDGTAQERCFGPGFGFVGIDVKMSSQYFDQLIFRAYPERHGRIVCYFKIHLSADGYLARRTPEG